MQNKRQNYRSVYLYLHDVQIASRKTKNLRANVKKYSFNVICSYSLYSFYFDLLRRSKLFPVTFSKDLLSLFVFEFVPHFLDKIWAFAY
jgi:hypothetical protein